MPAQLVLYEQPKMAKRGACFSERTQQATTVLASRITVQPLFDFPWVLFPLSHEQMYNFNISTNYAMGCYPYHLLAALKGCTALPVPATSVKWTFEFFCQGTVQ